jgi:hypothetical protein
MPAKKKARPVRRARRRVAWPPTPTTGAFHIVVDEHAVEVGRNQVGGVYLRQVVRGQVAGTSTPLTNFQARALGNALLEAAGEGQS